MVALLAPVDAVADRLALARLDAEVAQQPRAAVGQLVAHVAPAGREAVLARGGRLEAAVAAGQRAALDERAHERGPQAARDVVVARARAAQRVRTGAIAQRAHRRLGGDGAERLDDLGDRRPGQPEVAVAPVALDGQKARLDEPCEVLAG